MGRSPGSRARSNDHQRIRLPVPLHSGFLDALDSFTVAGAALGLRMPDSLTSFPIIPKTRKSEGTLHDSRRRLPRGPDLRKGKSSVLSRKELS